MSEVNKNRINRVVDYIQANLEKGLSLKQLSKVACFSEFHFSRIFRNTMGESVYQFVRRLRVEKSAELLLVNPNKSVTEISSMCGFATPSSFAKSFKNHFKTSATEWRKKQNACIDKGLPAIPAVRKRISISNGSPVWTFKQGDTTREVFVEALPPLTVAYVRNVGSYEGDDALFDKLYAQLFQWAVPRGYISETTFVLNIYHDNPEITEKQKLRVMVAIPVSGAVSPSGSVGVTQMSGGKYAICRFLLKKDEFAQAWDWMLSVWLANSGYEWDNREAFERCVGENNVDDERVFDVEICVPIKAK